MWSTEGRRACTLLFPGRRKRGRPAFERDLTGERTGAGGDAAKGRSILELDGKAAVEKNEYREQAFGDCWGGGSGSVPLVWVAVTQIFLTWQSGKESSERTDRILDSVNWLARSMNGALRDAERSRVESEQRASQSLAASINIARGEQRAWIGVSQMGLKDSPARVGIPLSATVVTINSGRTPAVKVRSPIAAAYMKAGTKLVHPKFKIVGLPSAGVMLPNIPQIANTIPIEGS